MMHTNPWAPVRWPAVLLAAALTVALAAALCPGVEARQAVGEAERDVGQGPLSLGSGFPLEMLIPSHEPRAPRVEDRKEVRFFFRIHQSNTLVEGGELEERRSLFEEGRSQPRGGAILVDTEITRLAAEVAVGLGSGWEIGVEAAAMGWAGGVGDRAIENVHDVFNFPDDDREARPRDEVDLEVLGADGVLQVDGSPTHLSLSDMRVSVRRMLRREGRGGPAVLAEATVELPTGDEDRLVGSGSWEGRLSVHASEGWGDRHFLVWGLSRVFVDELEGVPLPLRDAWHAHVGYEWYASGWSVPVQLAATNAPYASGYGEASQGRILLQAGVRRVTPRWGWEAGFSQNLTLEDNNADFALTAGWLWRWGRNPGAGTAAP